MKRFFVILLCAALLCGCTQSGDLRWSGSLPAQLTESDLRNAAVQFADVNDGFPTTLVGDFTGTEIRTDWQAFRAFASLADVLGIADFPEEIRLANTAEGSKDMIYCFAQYYQGVPLAGLRSLLYVEKASGHIRSLSCAYVPDIDLNTVPQISAADAQKTVSQQYGVSTPEKPELVIRREHSGLTLAWIVRTDADAPSEVWLDAQTGAELYAEYPADYFGGA